MASGATEWAWEHSRARNGPLIVLLAIAREIDRTGEEVEMSVAQIANSARLADRAVRLAVKELERLGELAVTPRSGGVSRYALKSAPADIAGVPRQILHPGRICTPAESAGPVDNPGAKPQVSGTPADSAGVSGSDDLSSSVVSGRRSKPSTSEPPREDAERLCQHLADLIEANGSKRPNIGKAWRDAARRMLDLDGRTEEQVMRAIDWCQKDEFWHRNILSMPTLREQYDRLRLAALAEQRKKARPARNGHQPTDDEFQALRDNWARPLDEMEGR